jgi:predicted Fe-Mo cluster-binding NifX family protein
MKIAITSSGSTLEAKVDPRFGRCKCFLIIDTVTESVEVVDNEQNLNAAQGAGIQAAETVVRSGAAAVLTGHCGPKAFRTLSAANIVIYTGEEGTVAESMMHFKQGDLRAASDADVEGHWA